MMNRIKLCCLLLFFSNGLLYPQQWQKVGPYNGNGPTIEALLQDYLNPDILYASSNSEGIYKSFDKGETWFKISPDFISGQMSAMAMAPDNSEVIYAGGSGGHIYKSPNGGIEWTEISGNLPALHIRDIEVNPLNSGQVFVAITKTYAMEGGLFVTTNNGESWQEISQSFNNKSVYSVAICPSDPLTLFAGSEQNTLYGILYKSTDGGLNWTEALSANIRDIKFDPDDNQKIIAVSVQNVYLSSDNGNSWDKISVTTTGILTFYEIAINSSNTSELFVCGQPTNPSIPRVFKSTDGGYNWSDADEGIETNGVHAIIIDIDNSQNIIAGSQIGVYKSNNGGQSWEISIQGMRRLYAGDILIKNEKPDHWIVLTSLGTQITENQGMDWSVTNKIIFPKSYLPGTNTVYGFLGLGSNSDGVYKSTDDGYTWQVLEWILNVTDLEMVYSNPSKLYVSTSNWIGMSSDGGSNWNDAESGIIEFPINRIVLNQAHPDTIYAASTTKVFKTTNGSNLWYELPGPFSTMGFNPVTLDIDPFDQEKIYVGTPTALIKSLNGGADWIVLEFPSTDFKTLAVSNVYENVLFAGFETSGVYFSLDGGETWTAMNDGLTGQFVNYLAISPQSDFLLCGTYRNAVYKCDISFLGIASNIYKDSDLLKVFPIPVKDKFNVYHDDSFSSFEIYNIRGELMKKYRKSDFNISEFAPGVYYLLAYPANGDKAKVGKIIKQ